MGQYLAIGLRLMASVKKEQEFDEISVEDVLSKVENRYNLSDIYERSEKEKYYVYSIKNEVLDKELVPLIEKFYALRYTKDLLDDRRFQAYQAGDDMDYFNPDIFPLREVCVSSNNAILSIDGKIAMECYGRVFDFFSRCIAAQLQEFALSKALTVWIDG